MALAGSRRVIVVGNPCPGQGSSLVAKCLADLASSAGRERIRLVLAGGMQLPPRESEEIETALTRVGRELSVVEVIDTDKAQGAARARDHRQVIVGPPGADGGAWDDLADLVLAGDVVVDISGGPMMRWLDWAVGTRLLDEARHDNIQVDVVVPVTAVAAAVAGAAAVLDALRKTSTVRSTVAWNERRGPVGGIGDHQGFASIHRAIDLGELIMPRASVPLWSGISDLALPLTRIAAMPVDEVVELLQFTAAKSDWAAQMLPHRVGPYLMGWLLTMLLQFRSVFGMTP